jgi:hypothetical protein
MSFGQKSIGQKSIGQMSFSQHVLAFSVGQNIRTFIVAID